MKTGYKIILIASILLALGGLSYISYRIYQNKKNGNGAGPAEDADGDGGSGNGNGNGGNGTPPPPQTSPYTPFSEFNIGDTVFAVNETCVYDKSPLSGGQIKKCYQPGAYVGTVNTKGLLAMTLRNFNDFGQEVLYLQRYDNKYSKG